MLKQGSQLSNVLSRFNALGRDINVTASLNAVGKDTGKNLNAVGQGIGRTKAETRWSVEQ